MPDYLKDHPECSSICKNLWRLNYSKAPIPAMLHACAESRRVALGWYKLALRPMMLDKPRIYFDFDVDYLCVGCNECSPSFCCDDCSYKVYFGDYEAVRRILVLWASRNTSPFSALNWHFTAVKEVLIFDSPDITIEPETQLAHLQETTRPFDWQGERNLYDAFLEEKPKLDNFWARFGKTIREAENTPFLFGDVSFEALAKIPGPLNPTKIARVALAVTPKY